MAIFRYDVALLERFPLTCGGIIHARDLRPGQAKEELRAAFAREQETTLAQIGAGPLGELPEIAAWRRTFRGFGLRPTQYRCAAEALLRRLTKQGDIPAINPLVDIGNLVSIRHRLPLAVFDLRAVSGGVTVRFAAGNERFTDLGSGETQQPRPGEVVFSDECGMVIARRWCWRQSAESASQEDTREALLVVEAQHEGGREAVARARDDLLALLAQHAGGEHGAALLDAQRPAFCRG